MVIMMHFYMILTMGCVTPVYDNASSVLFL